MLSNSAAQTEIKLNASGRNFAILEQSPYKLKIKASFDKIKTIPVATLKGDFIELVVDGLSKIYDIGKPQLPVLGKLIEIPQGADVRVNIIGYKEELINLNNLGMSNKIMPAQPSVSKSADENEIPFYYDKAAYKTRAFTHSELVSVTNAGTMRGVRIGNITVAPFSYNPVSNMLKVYNDLVFEVVFKNPDIHLTEQLKEKYYSSRFESSLGSLINYTPPQSKDMLTSYPIKYVIVGYSNAGLDFQTAMQPFVYWKRQKGFTVIEQYYSSAPSAATVKSFLEGLYNAGTPGDPAPTYVLFVGDVAQIPTNTGVANTATRTDLYFCTFDGASDYLPDMYYGRFSATTLAQLQPQIDKTLEYEKYTMPNKTYMDTVVMIGGVDATYGPVWANGQINYGTSTYFNAAHGIYSYTHLYPNSGSEDALILSEIGKGVGYANYTAHGSSSGWADPTFSVSNIPSMNNAHKYGLLVGNCCLSNTFNDSECFGEALLRAANKGAMGYIGASNNSYWDEDYYWGVGKRASIVLNPTYDANNLGAYDCSFHDHGEPKSAWSVTTGQMIHSGNLAVESSSSSLKKYYWEIYHLMGDPSVMTYFSEPDPLYVSYNNIQSSGISSLVVNTEEDAYVALSQHGTLLDAELAPTGGVVTLTFAAITLPDTLDVVVTKQNKQPYIGTLIIMAPTVTLDAELLSINIPETSYTCVGMNVSPVVVIRNMGINTITSLVITGQVSGGMAQPYNWSGSLSLGQTAQVTLPSILINSGTYTFTATVSLPNNAADMNSANDSKSKMFTAANLPVSSNFSANNTSLCTIPATVQFTNLSTNALSYLWDFGDGTNSTQANPQHMYTNLGTFTVTLTAYAGVCGNAVQTKTSYIVIGGIAPSATGASRCGVGTVSLSAIAAGSGTLTWYTDPSGGTSIGTGSPFTTPVINATTTYYVSEENSTYSTSTVTIGSGTNTSGSTESAISPFGTYYHDSRHQFLLLASELTAAGLMPGDITSLAFNIASIGGQPMLGFNISMGTTTANVLTTTFETGLTTVYSSSSYLPAATGWQTLAFPSPFVWNGTSNIVIQVCYDNASYTTSTAVYYSTAPANLHHYGYMDNGTGCSMTAPTYNGVSTSRANMKLGGTVVTTCASARSAVPANVTSADAVTVSADSLICSGQEATLQASSVNPGYSYVWTPGNLVGAGQTVSPSNTTAYTVTGTDNSTGCANSASVQVVVNPNPAAIAVTPDSTYIGSITPLVVTGGTITNMTLFSEDFNGANPWTTVNSSTGGTPANAAWTLHPDAYVYSSYTFHSNDNSQFYMSNSDAQGSGGTTHTQLISPVINTMGWSSLTLTFWHYYRYYTSGSSATVDVSTDGGTTWNVTPLVSVGSTQGSAASFVQVVVDMTAYVGQSNLKIRFNYTDAYGWYWCIDNVSLTGDATAPIVWSPTTGLYMDAGATLPYTGGNATTVYADPAFAVTYTATATNTFGCTSAATAEFLDVNKALLLNVFLEGLYSGPGLMNQAGNGSGAEYGAGIADRISVSLHDASDYSTVIFEMNDIDLATGGQAVMPVPSAFGDDYYIAVTHRSSIETVSAVPVSFAGSVISYDFTSAASQAYGNNLKAVEGGYYAIYGGDANQDGIVDGSDMALIDNASTPPALQGYFPEDVNGDGIVDGSDMTLIDNNSRPPAVQVIRP